MGRKTNATGRERRAEKTIREWQALPWWRRLWEWIRP